MAVCSNIESLHRMTREERDLHGVVVNGSDHLTAYNLYAEAVNQHGYIGEVYGLPRHLFEDGLEEWAERRGRAGQGDRGHRARHWRRCTARSSCRSRSSCPTPPRSSARSWADLVARVMPFDLVIDEHTADGQEARVSKTSVAGSWGAVAGDAPLLRRPVRRGQGVDRRNHDLRTTWSEPVRGARRGPRWSSPGRRKHQRLAVERRRTYFGFELETEVEPLEGPIPEALRPAEARDVLADALMAGEVDHPDATRLRRGRLGARRALAPIGR